jgi:putative PIN family toxin of toxin-antitoxin system
MMLNAVLDTNIMVSGLLTADGKPAQVINALKSGRFCLVYSAEIMAEYREVLQRERLGLNKKDVDELLEIIAETGIPVLSDRSNIDIPDEDDRVFYDAAKSSGAYLVTGNLRHFPAGAFVVAPAVFLAMLESGGQS